VKTKVILMILSVIFILTGCVDNKNISRTELLNKNESLNKIFSKMFYKNENYPYIYQVYLSKRGEYIDDSNILNNLDLLCKSRGGKVMYVNDFAIKYKLDKSSIADRCFTNLDIDKVCFIPKKFVPKILFVWEDGEKINKHYHFDYVQTGQFEGVKYAYISNTPTRIIVTHTVESHIKVCLPDQTDWPYFFTSARKAFLEKQKLLAKKKIELERKKKEEELDDGYRRF